MKLAGAVLTLLLALMIEAVAGYFSVVGLAALFAAAFWPVVVMGGTLEAGKLVAATWLKANLKNPKVATLHKVYLFAAILVLMSITSLGIYGYLAKAHLEQEANLPAIEIQIKQSEARIQQATDERVRAEARLTQLDQSVSTLLANAKTAKEAESANRARDAQKRERADIQRQITALNKEVNGLNEQLVPLRLKIADVSAKLGPVKYVAKLFGWEDPSSAVQLIILLIMFAFDPLAVVMVLSGTMTLNEYAAEAAPRREERRRRKAAERVAAVEAKARLDALKRVAPTPAPVPTAAPAPAPSVVPVPPPEPEPIVSPPVTPDPVTTIPLPPAPPPPTTPIPVLLFNETPAAPSPEEIAMEAAQAEAQRLKAELDSQRALFTAMQSEIAALRATQVPPPAVAAASVVAQPEPAPAPAPVEEEKLTFDELPYTILQSEDEAGFNKFSANYTQPDK